MARIGLEGKDLCAPDDVVVLVIKGADDEVAPERRVARAVPVLGDDELCCRVREVFRLLVRVRRAVRSHGDCESVTGSRLGSEPGITKTMRVCLQRCIWIVPT